MKTLKRSRFVLTFVFVLFLCAYSQAQSASGILASSRMIDWSRVGTTIPTTRTQCGSTIAAYSGTAAAINSAIATCGTSQYVLLGAGTFNLSTGITFAGKSNVTLRGAGPDQTLLVFTGRTSCMFGNADICVAGNSGRWGGNTGTVYTWTGGLSQGSTTLTFSSASGISVGDLLVLDQLDDSSDTGNIFINGTTTYSNEGNNPGRGGNRNQQQYVKVTAISGTNITITPGIYMPNWRSGQTPQAWDLGTIGTGVITGVGIEDLSIDGSNDGGGTGDTLTEFSIAYGNWYKDIRSIKGSRNHIWAVTQAHLQVQDSYFYGTKNAASQSYGVELYTGSDSLIQNNIFQQVTAPHMNGDDSGSVWAYNFSINDYYNVTDFMMPSSWSHGAGDEMILFEGNVGAGLALDDIHGTGAMNTAFRNRWTGSENASQMNQTETFINSEGTRYTNAIGNVLGTSGVHTIYQQTTGTSGSGGKSIYILGCCEAAGSTWASGSDTLIASTLMRWGNYDTVHAAVQWNSAEVPTADSYYPNAVPSSHALPASFYLNSQPSWWSGVPWPAIGPDVVGGNMPNLGGYANYIPAQNCFLSTMQGPSAGSGGVLTYNAKNCYGGQGTQSTVAPIITNITVK